MGTLTWNKQDLDFDSAGQLVIRNEALIKRIQEVIDAKGRLEINYVPLTDGECVPGNRRCPQPNTVCGCELRSVPDDSEGHS